MEIQRQLQSAFEKGRPVRVVREEIEEGWVDGFVVGIGHDLFVLLVVGDGIDYEGFNCLRYADVSEVDLPHPYASFIERAIELRGAVKPVLPPVDLSCLELLLRTAGSLFSVVSIHREVVDPDTVEIGKVEEVAHNQVLVTPISPSAEWLDETESYPLEEITRIDFGCPYEEALVLVAGSG